MSRVTTPSDRPGYVEAVANAGAAVAAARARRDSLPAEQAAVEAYTPGGPSVAELEARIVAARECLTAA